MAAAIRSEAAAWAVGWVESVELDRIGLAAALRRAQRSALEQLGDGPDVVLADGRDRLELPWRTEMIVKGDATVASIAAASIVAKVARDAYMVELCVREPRYGFSRHKGYGTRAHLEALRRYGACREHRRSFGPVAAVDPQALNLVASG